MFQIFQTLIFCFKYWQYTDKSAPPLPKYLSTTDILAVLQTQLLTGTGTFAGSKGRYVLGVKGERYGHKYKYKYKYKLK